MKIVTTALLSVFFLQRHISSTRWLSIGLLSVGVILVQRASLESREERTNAMIGLVAVLLACLTSAFAGVYLEKLIKSTSDSVWIRNIQLGLSNTV